jgi:hypothetical protein
MILTIWIDFWNILWIFYVWRVVFVILFDWSQKLFVNFEKRLVLILSLIILDLRREISRITQNIETIILNNLIIFIVLIFSKRSIIIQKSWILIIVDTNHIRWVHVVLCVLSGLVWLSLRIEWLVLIIFMNVSETFILGETFNQSFFVLIFFYFLQYLHVRFRLFMIHMWIYFNIICILLVLSRILIFLNV